MNKDTIQGHWTQLKGKVRKQWGKLTDDQVEKMKGSYQELAGILQKEYGYEKDRADREINSFLEKNRITETTEDDK